MYLNMYIFYKTISFIPQSEFQLCHHVKILNLSFKWHSVKFTAHTFVKTKRFTTIEGRSWNIAEIASYIYSDNTIILASP